MMMALPPGVEWFVPVLGLGYLALGIRWLVNKVRDANKAEATRLRGLIAESTEDAAGLAETRAMLVLELKAKLTAKEKELAECKESGARISHSYFELQGRMDEFERRLLDVERPRAKART